MRFTALADWLSWLETLHPRAIDLGLERVRAVADRLAIDLSACQVVTIAGTNGKGSCAAALEAVCLAAHRRVGCYTSPHLLRYNERIRVGGLEVADDDIVAAFDRIDRVLQGDSLTYFEFGTLAALDIFQHSGLDVVILEVGLGGRLDAVNLVDADIAVVTSIALDHQDWLGDTREAIAVEKAGVFRPRRPAICAQPNPPRTLVDHAKAIGADLMLRGTDFDLEVSAGRCWWSAADRDNARAIPGLDTVHLPLASVAAALRAAELLGIDQRYWGGAGAIGLPGRFQRIEAGGREVVLDVAHNPEAAALLALRLATEAPTGARQALFAVMADKDIEHIVEPLRAHFSRWWVASLPAVPRAASGDAVAAIVRRQVAVPVEVGADVASAFSAALQQLPATDELVVFGSFYTVAAVLEAVSMTADGAAPG